MTLRPSALHFTFSIFKHALTNAEKSLICKVNRSILISVLNPYLNLLYVASSIGIISLAISTQSDKFPFVLNYCIVTLFQIDELSLSFLHISISELIQEKFPYPLYRLWWHMTNDLSGNMTFYILFYFLNLFVFFEHPTISKFK